MQSLFAHLHESHHLFGRHVAEVVENFGEAADAGEARVTGRRARRQQAALEHEHTFAGKPLLDADGGGKAHDAAAEQDAVVLQQALFFPVTEHAGKFRENLGDQSVKCNFTLYIADGSLL